MICQRARPALDPAKDVRESRAGGPGGSSLSQKGAGDFLEVRP